MAQTDKFEEELAKRRQQGGSAPLQVTVTPRREPSEDAIMAEFKRRFPDRTPGDPVDPIGPAQSFLTSANIGLTGLFGAPVDLATAALNPAFEAAGLERIEKPLLGSESLRSGLESAGSIAPNFEERLAASPDTSRMASVAGRVVGEGIGLAAAPLAVARRGQAAATLATTFPRNIAGRGATSRTGRALQTTTEPISARQAVAPILENARTQPGKFAAVETGSLAGAAQLGAISEGLAPGNELARTGAEITGGFLNPLGLTARTFIGVGRNAKNLIGSATRSGRKRRAADVMVRELIRNGEDPVSVAASLRAADTVTTPLTAAQKSGSPTLKAMESKLARRNAKFSNLSEDRFKTAFEDLRRQIDNLSSLGDPDALRQASILRERYFDDLLTQRVNDAQRVAAERAAQIPSASRASASSAVRETLEDALGEVRKVENSLWKQVPRDISVNPQNLRAARARVESELLDEDTLPFGRTIARVTKGQTSTGELLRVRSRLLESTRELRAANKFGEARRARELADAITEDIGQLDLPAVNEARQFSRLKNDVFTRTIAGRAIGSGRQGEDRIPAELLLERAFSDGETRGNLQFQQLERAGQLGDRSTGFFGVGTDTPLLGEGMFRKAVLGDQEAFLGQLARETVRDGVVDPAALERFRRKNAELLQRFPELQGQLEDAGAATETLKRAQRTRTNAMRAIAKQAAFARVAGVENPVDAVGKILRGSNPRRDIGQLARMARKSGPGATEGLKSAALQSAIRRSRGANGIEFSKLNENLGGVTRILRLTGVMSPAEAKRLDKVVERAEQLEDVVKSGQRVDELTGDPGFMFDFATRVAGVQAASRSPAAVSGPGQLVVAGAASRAAKNLFEKIPATRINEVLIQAAENPKFAADLLERPKTPARRKQLSRQINAFLIQAGLIEDEDDAE